MSLWYELVVVAAANGARSVLWWIPTTREAVAPASGTTIRTHYAGFAESATTTNTVPR